MLNAKIFIHISPAMFFSWERVRNATWKLCWHKNSFKELYAVAIIINDGWWYEGGNISSTHDTLSTISGFLRFLLMMPIMKIIKILCVVKRKCGWDCKVISSGSIWRFTINYLKMCVRKSKTRMVKFIASTCL